jgi:hypothetical protein
MIDKISKLRDHVNVSIMKAVQVDEFYRRIQMSTVSEIFKYFIIRKTYSSFWLTLIWFARVVTTRGRFVGGRERI